MVASSAKTRRPRPSAVALGPIFLAADTKASIAAAGEDAGAAGILAEAGSFLSVMRDHGSAQHFVLSGAACNSPRRGRAGGSVQGQARHAVASPLPGADRAPVDADVLQPVAQGDEVAL